MSSFGHERPFQVLNEDGALVVPVYEGKCGRLLATGEHVLMNKELLPDEFELYGVQRSVCASLFWLLVDGKRYNNQCYCTYCKSIVNGSGGNLRAHEATHATIKKFTEEEKTKAWILFLIKHNVGLTSLRDPLARILHPGVTYQRAAVYVASFAQAVKKAIQTEVRERNVVIMVDGWSDQSLRRYLGAAVGFYSDQENMVVYRGLGLIGSDGERHTARNQAEILARVLDEYGVFRRNCSCLVSDSAAVNAALAQEMNLDWCPCSVHTWNLIARNFIFNSPPLLLDLLSRINALRTKSRWVEFMTKHSTRRNLSGYTPTRWCSATLCLRSFYENVDYVKAYQASESKSNTGPTFTDKDVKLISEVINVLERFNEANNMLMQADKNEGLASVFEIVNAMYYVLKGKQDGEFGEACARAAAEIEERFFNLRSRSCCRLILAGVLNVRHSLPDWLRDDLEVVAGLLANEVDVFTGATPPGSPHEQVGQRYSDDRCLADIIDGSSATSEQSEIAVQEVAEFLQRRSSLGRQTFTSFWSQCDRFRHIRMLALALRRLPTNTVWIEQAFSKARRVLTWTRMKMTPSTAGDLWLLNVNSSITEQVLGFRIGNAVITDEEEGSDSDAFLDDDRMD